MDTPPSRREEPPTIDGQPAAEPSTQGSPATAPPNRKRSELDPAIQPGTDFGRYHIIRLLGRGGMGAVYLATDTQLKRPVALKVPNLAGGEGSVLRQRMVREARIAAQAQHPNLCQVYDYGEHDGVFYLSMAYIEGRPLSDLIRGGQKLPIRAVVSVVRNLAQAMAVAHKLGIVHRDLKPSNIMITSEKQPVVMDFGLAKQADEDVRLTKSGALVGTPAYMSPEQVEAETVKIGPATDIYSLGVILYELLAGRLPFTGSVGTLMAQILREPPPPPSQFRPELEPELERICLKALAKQPRNRFADMREFAKALDQYLKSGAEPGRSTRYAVVPLEGTPAAAKDGAEVAELFHEMAAHPTPNTSSGGRKAVPDAPKKRQRRGFGRRRWAILLAVALAGISVPAWWWITATPKPLPPLSTQGSIPTSEEYQRHRSILAKQPDDPVANRIVGGRLALYDGNWDGGLNRLKIGDLAEWRELAFADLKAKDDPGAAGQRGDAWWNQARAEKDVLRAGLFWRAAEWYATALGNNDGYRSHHHDRLRKVRGQPKELDSIPPSRVWDIDSRPLDFPLGDTGGGTRYQYTSNGYTLIRSMGSDAVTLIGNQSGTIACSVTGAIVSNGGGDYGEWRLILKKQTSDQAEISVGISPIGVVIQGPGNKRRTVRPSWDSIEPNKPNTITVIYVGGAVEAYVNGVAVVAPIRIEEEFTPAEWRFGISVNGQRPETQAIFKDTIKVWNGLKVLSLFERAAKVR